jgi:Zn-dependent peptidase ImmA (M78 family)
MTMRVLKKDLAREAQSKSLALRRELNIDPISPVCIYEICEKLGITVQFVDKIPSLEGIYLNQEKRILISSLRPLARQRYTCGHELGHHLFDHGCKVDELCESAQRYDPQEFLVDCFSGFLLMPKLALISAFTARNWIPESATPRQIFAIACNFGVGYDTIINHMAYALKMISSERSQELKKHTPKSIRQELFGEHLQSSYLIIADKKWISKTIDVEVGHHILVPKTAELDSQLGINYISEIPSLSEKIVRVEKPGIIRMFCPESEWAVFIRISRINYEGHSIYRHLEDCDDE